MHTLLVCVRLIYFSSPLTLNRIMHNVCLGWYNNRFLRTYFIQLRSATQKDMKNGKSCGPASLIAICRLFSRVLILQTRRCLAGCGDQLVSGQAYNRQHHRVIMCHLSNRDMNSILHHSDKDRSYNKLLIALMRIWTKFATVARRWSKITINGAKYTCQDVLQYSNSLSDNQSLTNCTCTCNNNKSVIFGK